MSSPRPKSPAAPRGAVPRGPRAAIAPLATPTPSAGRSGTTARRGRERRRRPAHRRDRASTAADAARRHARATPARAPEIRRARAVIDRSLESVRLSGTAQSGAGIKVALSQAKTQSHAGVLAGMRAWLHVGAGAPRLRATGPSSRDKFMATGQQTAVSGETVGIYLLRNTAAVPDSSRPKPYERIAAVGTGGAPTDGQTAR